MSFANLSSLPGYNANATYIPWPSYTPSAAATTRLPQQYAKPVTGLPQLNTMGAGFSAPAATGGSNTDSGVSALLSFLGGQAQSQAQPTVQAPTINYTPSLDGLGGGLPDLLHEPGKTGTVTATEYPTNGAPWNASGNSSMVGGNSSLTSPSGNIGTVTATEYPTSGPGSQISPSSGGLIGASQGQAASSPNLFGGVTLNNGQALTDNAPTDYPSGATSSGIPSWVTHAALTGLGYLVPGLGMANTAYNAASGLYNGFNSAANGSPNTQYAIGDGSGGVSGVDNSPSTLSQIMSPVSSVSNWLGGLIGSAYGPTGGQIDATDLGSQALPQMASTAPSSGSYDPSHNYMPLGFFNVSGDNAGIWHGDPTLTL